MRVQAMRLSNVVFRSRVCQTISTQRCPPRSLFQPSLAQKALVAQYQRVVQLHSAFFASHLTSEASPSLPCQLLVIDFDGTCTRMDTSETIIQAACSSLVQSVQAEHGADKAQLLRDELTTLRARLVENYRTKRQSLLEDILPSGTQSYAEEDSPDEFDMAWFGEFMDRISDFDKDMNSVVIDSGILAGIVKGTLSRQGANVEMQPGCMEFLKRAVKEAGLPVCILSVNWSGEFVASTLVHPPEGPFAPSDIILADPSSLGAGNDETRICPPGKITIYCNELEYFGEISTGNIQRKCENASDKGRLLDDLLLSLASLETTSTTTQQCPPAGGESRETPAAASRGTERPLSLYIGDSMNDLPALVSSDVGIFIGSSMDPLVVKVCGIAGIEIRPLAAAFPLFFHQNCDWSLGRGEPGGGMMPVLYHATGWREVEMFFFGGIGITSLGRPDLEALVEGSSSSANKRLSVVPDPSCGNGLSEGVHSKTDSAGNIMNPSSEGETTTTKDFHRSLVHWHGKTLPRVLAISGSDSSGGAGIQADAKTCLAINAAHCLTAVTALTAQNTHGIEAVHTVPPEFVRRQIATVLKDFSPVVVKIGMLALPETVEVVADELRAWGPPKVVLDPILTTSLGEALGVSGIGDALLRHVFPLATIVTMTWVQAEALLGGRERFPIDGLDEMKAAAQHLAEEYGPKYVLLCGGEQEEDVDVLFDGRSFIELGPMKRPTASLEPRERKEKETQSGGYREGRQSGKRVYGRSCVLSSAIAALLAGGVSDVPEAVRRAEKYMGKVVERSREYKLGMGPRTPVCIVFEDGDV